LFLVSVPVEGALRGPFPPTYFYALAWLSFLSAAAITIWNTLLQRPGVKVSLLNMWKFLIPVSGAILSWMILTDENPDLFSVLGMGFITLALIALNYSNQRHTKKKTGLISTM
jgi:drug/metabolite transporter (DMT)-like permease